MLKQLTTFILFLILSNLYSQDVKVYGIVLDIEGDPAAGVTYFLKSSPKNKFRTSRDGKFSIQLMEDKYDSLIFKSVQFERNSSYIGKRTFKKAAKNQNKFYLKITLEDPKFNILTIRPSRPDTLCCDPVYSVEDYEFLADGRLIVLTYDKTLKKGSVLRLMDANFKELDNYYLAGDALELKKDYRGNIHLIAEERVFLIYFESNQIKAALEDRDYYFRYVVPIIDTIGSNIYFSNFSDIYPAFDYFEFNTADSTYNVMLKVEDTLMMELYRAEFKYVDIRTKIWAHYKQLETGIDKEVWVGATVFTNSIYYEPLYAPLFKTGEDSIVVFDHYKNKMFRYTPKAGFVDSTRISYHLNHRKSGWEQPIIQDQSTGKVYAIFLKGGYTYLSEIDRNTGSVKKSFKLFFKYVNRIQIIDSQVYYIYRPFESVQKKFLYKEKLG
jgi:hypothetical protein